MDKARFAVVANMLASFHSHDRHALKAMFPFILIILMKLQLCYFLNSYSRGKMKIEFFPTIFLT